MASISLMYPSNGTFNIKYFTEKHMPLVSEAWGSEGLENWEVTQFEAGNPYMVQATLKFESMKKWENASSGPSASRVFGDYANFTTVQPQVMRGSVKGSHRTSLKEKKIFGS